MISVCTGASLRRNIQVRIDLQASRVTFSFLNFQHFFIPNLQFLTYLDLIGYFFNVDWNNDMPIHEHPFFNFMFLAQVFIPDNCQLRKSLDRAVAEFTRKWITSMAPKYLTDKNGKKALKLDRIKKLLSNKDYEKREKQREKYEKSVDATLN